MKKEPTLRFPEFSGGWAKKRLGEVAEFYKGRGLSKKDILKDGKSECLLYGELYTQYSETIKEIKSRTNLDIDNKNLTLSRANDILIPSSGESSKEIAKASCILKDNVIIGSDINIIRTKLNGIFLAYYLNSAKRVDIAKLSQGASVVHLYKEQLKSLIIRFPPTLSEQQKIASFLLLIDKKIDLTSQKLEKLKEYKRGLLQKMFV